jgi:hypothetical protein
MRTRLPTKMVTTAAAVASGTGRPPFGGRRRKLAMATTAKIAASDEHDGRSCTQKAL